MKRTRPSTRAQQVLRGGGCSNGSSSGSCGDSHVRDSSPRRGLSRSCAIVIVMVLLLLLVIINYAYRLVGHHPLLLLLLLLPLLLPRLLILLPLLPLPLLTNYAYRLVGHHPPALQISHDFGGTACAAIWRGMVGDASDGNPLVVVVVLA